MQCDEHIIFHISCQSIRRQGRRDVPHATLTGKLGAAFLPSSARLKRKRIFQRLFYVDAHYEQTMRDRTLTLPGYASKSSVEARTSVSEECDTELQSALVTIMHLVLAADADEDAADFNFGDAPGTGDASVAGQDESE